MLAVILVPYRTESLCPLLPGAAYSISHFSDSIQLYSRYFSTNRLIIPTPDLFKMNAILFSQLYFLLKLIKLPFILCICML